MAVFVEPIANRHLTIVGGFTTPHPSIAMPNGNPISRVNTGAEAYWVESGANMSIFGTVGEYCIEFWAAASSGDASNYVSLERASADYTTREWRVSLVPGALSFQHFNNVGAVVFTATTSLLGSSLRHYVLHVTNTGTGAVKRRFRWYVDGTLVGHTTHSVAFTNAAPTTPRIAVRAIGTTSTAFGWFGFYKRQLGLTEVQRHLTGGSLL